MRSCILHTVKRHLLQLTERLKESLRENLHALIKRKLRHGRFHAFHFHFIILSGALKRDSNISHALCKRGIYNHRDHIQSQLISRQSEVMLLKRQIIRVSERYIMTRAILRSQQDDSYKWRLACS